MRWWVKEWVRWRVERMGRNGLRKKRKAGKGEKYFE